MVLIVFCLILAVIWLVSKFVLGINFSVMENGGYISFGYHEIRGSEIWALSFDSFSGSTYADGTFPDNAKRRLLIHSGTSNTPLELKISSGGTDETHVLTGEPLDLTLPGDSDRFRLTISGNEVQSGYFSAVWE